MDTETLPDTATPDASTDGSIADPLVRFRGVQKTYDGETLVVKGLDLDIARGEFLTLLGPSGSGKTTCLMMLAGFEMPTGGDILLDGDPITTLPPHKRDIGMVFQNYALFPHMSVAENLAFPLKVRGMAPGVIATKVADALDMVELEDFGGRMPAQLSGGQQQRVAVARALVFEPKLVLMDEPLGALDRMLREQMQLEIKHLHESLGITIVYVTHDQGEALTMSDRIAVFNDGVIQQVDPPARLYEEPQNSFVASFIGESNRLAGEIRGTVSGKVTVALDGSNGLVLAAPVAVRDTGARTLLSIRPERVHVLSPGDTASYDNVFEGTVRELIYLGDHVRARLTLGGNDDFVVKVPNMAGSAPLARGDTVRVGWSADDAHALDYMEFETDGPRAAA
ncbi:Putrescine transport ATP-binding protein PotA (TC 3.A.1.11.1) [Candidatus Phaeomarinobacter ectocarpi]|uniref:Spermidine/putrescine import ATP-binding protein PotA n=1 Tax=Candidatus Phaeomarinibacter ectocarpi TaxID=1458461 RepID=X5MG20_9HYPH|nr:ABC transporter ATP-binding protein [Candidatus Phaeomarinobacter ectocarpi]CDO60324.1 Putrescine transport ATP-binding protein PotA (TC 3.A.1.11.1) [Candidatus Phaeomarinobacter ectocarpi]